jgi:hypothetical protein
MRMLFLRLLFAGVAGIPAQSLNSRSLPDATIHSAPTRSDCKNWEIDDVALSGG